MRKLCLSFLAQVIMGSTVLAGGNTVQYLAVAQIVDIKEVYRTNKVKRYSDCRDVGSTTLCDTIEWVTINDTIDFYRVTLNLGGKNGKNFVIRQKTRPTGDKRKVSVKVTTYGK